MSKIRKKQIHQMALSFASALFINSGYRLFNDGSMTLNELDQSMEMQTKHFFLLYSNALLKFKKLNDDQIKEEACRLFESFPCQ